MSRDANSIPAFLHTTAMLRSTNRFLYLLVSSCFFLVISCAGHNIRSYTNDQYYIPIYQCVDSPQGESPEFFEQSIPDSNILLNSVITFYKSYQTKVLFKKTNNFFISDKIIAFLSNNNIFVNSKRCNNILLNEKYEKIYIDHHYMALESIDKVDIFSLRECGQFFSYRKKLSNIYFKWPLIVFYEGKQFKIHKIGYNEEYSSEKLESDILHLYIYNIYLCIINTKGELLIIDTESNSNIKTLFLNSDLKSVGSYKNFIYGISSDNIFKIWQLKSDNTSNIKINLHREIQLKNDDCILSKNSPATLCNNELLTYKKHIILENDYDSFGIIGDYLIGQINNDLHITYIDKKRFEKKMQLGKKTFKTCFFDNNIYFDDLDGFIKKINIQNNNLKIVEEYPEICDAIPTYQHGAFHVDNISITNYEENSSNDKKASTNTSLSIPVSEIVNMSNGYIMLKRKINDKIYYYFEK